MPRVLQTPSPAPDVTRPLLAPPAAPLLWQGCPHASLSAKRVALPSKHSHTRALSSPPWAGGHPLSSELVSCLLADLLPVEQPGCLLSCILYGSHALENKSPGHCLQALWDPSPPPVHPAATRPRRCPQTRWLSPTSEPLHRLSSYRKCLCPAPPWPAPSPPSCFCSKVLLSGRPSQPTTSTI